MKYLFVEQNKLPQVCETNDIYQVIKDMFGNDYMTLNEDDSRLGMSKISKSKYTGLRELINDAQRWDCLWIGVSNCYGEVEDMVRLLYDMNSRKRCYGVIMKPLIITGLDYKGLTKEQIHYYNCFFGKRSIDEMNKFIEKNWS